MVPCLQPHLAPCLVLEPAAPKGASAAQSDWSPTGVLQNAVEPVL